MSSSACSLRCRLRREVTVEANPETVTPELAALLRRAGVTPSLARRAELPGRTCSRRSSGWHRRTPSGAPSTISVMPDSTTSRSISSTGSPGQSTADLERDLDEALALEPEHLSCYELEAKPGTRFTHTFGDELARQAEAMEGYFEQVVETLTGAGYRWYETANFCRLPSARAGATCGPGTTSPTGSAATTSASASARCRPSTAAVGGTGRASTATSLALGRGAPASTRGRAARRRRSAT